MYSSIFFAFFPHGVHVVSATPKFAVSVLVLEIWELFVDHQRAFCLSGIPQSSKPQFWAGSQGACEYDPDILPPLRYSPFSIRITAAVFSQSPCVFRRRTLCADTSAQIRCGICNSTSYALNCSCHSFLSDLPLFCSLQLPDRISTITEGVLFFLIGSSLFLNHSPSEWFSDTKIPETMSFGDFQQISAWRTGARDGRP